MEQAGKKTFRTKYCMGYNFIKITEYLKAYYFQELLVNRVNNSFSSLPDELVY